MKISSSSIRLKEIMEKQNLKQIDILNKTLPFCEKYNVKMNKSNISQYVSGKVEPSQDKIMVLSMALGVSEGWLMGFDDETKEYSEGKAKVSKEIAEEDFEFYNKLSLLNKEEQEIIMNLINYMLSHKKSED
jgi:transcriptional regulator with XRE-family HTH domain|nr:MAG TPA: bifunctional HTH-domain containing protein/aminotransferase [Caudoviricetes sp.]